MLLIFSLSNLEGGGGALMWIMPLYIHHNQKYDYGMMMKEDILI